MAFEFRFKASDRSRPYWDAAFTWGSVVAAFFQGVTLGAYIDGIAMQGTTYTGGALDWLAPFPLFTGVGVVVTYALLGVTWLIMKTEGRLQWTMLRVTNVLNGVMVAMIAAVSIWTPLTHPEIAARWFALPNVFFSCPCHCWCWARPTASSVRCTAPERRPVPVCPAHGLHGLHRPGDQRLAQHHPAVDFDLGRIVAAAKPGLCAGWHAVHRADHPGIHVLVLLRVPRQGPPWRGVPLMARIVKSTLAARLAWLLALWAAGVGTVFVFAWLMRLLMRAAGLST